MKNELINTDPLDIEDLLVEVEKSFDIKFVESEFADVETFGVLCDRIIEKIELENSDSCTTQQAFYKLKKSIAKVTGFQNIKPETLLLELFPKKNRLTKIKELEDSLEFKISILQPKNIITVVLLFCILFSFVLLFINWKIGILGFSLSVLGVKISKMFGKELKVKTIRELTEKITREHYLKARSDSKTFNKNEIEIILTNWFLSELPIDNLTRESKLR